MKRNRRISLKQEHNEVWMELFSVQYTAKNIIFGWLLPSCYIAGREFHYVVFVYRNFIDPLSMQQLNLLQGGVEKLSFFTLYTIFCANKDLGVVCL